MANLRVSLGLVPSTERIEKQWAKINAEFKKLYDIASSDMFARYNELDAFVHSDDFTQRKNKIQARKYGDTEEYKKEQRYNELKNDKSVKDYYKIAGSSQLAEYERIDKSSTLKKYYRLEEYVKSKEFDDVKRYMALSGKEKFEQSNEFNALTNYNNLKNNPDIRAYLKLKKQAAFNDFVKLYGSEEAKNFEELEKKVTSAEFQAKLTSIPRKKRKNSPEYAEFTKYKNQKKHPQIKNYLKIKNSDYLEPFKKIHGSPEIEAYNELHQYVNSGDFKQAKKTIINQKFQDTEAYQKLTEYKNLKKSKDITYYFKFKNSALYKNYLDLHGSEKLKEYEDLKAFVASDEFKEVKEYMLLSPRKKFKLSKEKQMLEEYRELKKSDDIQYYFKNKDAKKFDELKTWTITFEEDFNAPAVDTGKWLTQYYWGDKLLTEAYSLAEDKHFISGNNVQVNNGVLEIVTKKEDVKGKAWEPTVGFFDKEFHFTSGLVNTGKSFRQKYGKFEAKIRFNENFPVNHAFWMVSDKKVPHIDVVRYSKFLSFNNFWRNGGIALHHNISKVKLAKYPKDFYIYGLEWTPDELKWTINGITVAIQNTGVPQEPMYIQFSSGVYEDSELMEPARCEIDWIRCFQKVE